MRKQRDLAALPNSSWCKFRRAPNSEEESAGSHSRDGCGPWDPQPGRLPSTNTSALKLCPVSPLTSSSTQHTSGTKPASANTNSSLLPGACYRMLLEQAQSRPEEEPKAEAAATTEPGQRGAAPAGLRVCSTQVLVPCLLPHGALLQPWQERATLPPSTCR